MAKSMLGKARTAAQKAATKKWQLAGAARRKRLGGSQSPAKVTTKLEAMRHGLKVLKSKQKKASIFKRMKYDNAVYKMNKKILTHVTMRNSNF